MMNDCCFTSQKKPIISISGFTTWNEPRILWAWLHPSKTTMDPERDHPKRKFHGTQPSIFRCPVNFPGCTSFFRDSLFIPGILSIISLTTGCKRLNKFLGLAMVEGSMDVPVPKRHESFRFQHDFRKRQQKPILWVWGKYEFEEKKTRYHPSISFVSKFRDPQETWVWSHWRTCHSSIPSHSVVTSSQGPLAPGRKSAKSQFPARNVDCQIAPRMIYHDISLNSRSLRLDSKANACT